MTTSITLRVFNFIKNRNPSQGKLRENCEKRFSQSASDDAKNPIKSRVFKKLHKQTKEVFKTARQNHLWVRIKYQPNDSYAKSSWVVFYLPFECKQIVKGEILRCSKCLWIGRESEGFYFLEHRALNEVPWKVRTFFKFSVVGMPIFCHRKVRG